MVAPWPPAWSLQRRVPVLYPRQDGEAEKIDQLSEGDSLVPMVQAAGGSDWYMVKTPKKVSWAG